MVGIKQLKKELGLSQKDIADFFDMEYNTFANSTAKKRYETALVRFYDKIKKPIICKICSCPIKDMIGKSCPNVLCERN